MRVRTASWIVVLLIVALHLAPFAAGSAAAQDDETTPTATTDAAADQGDAAGASETEMAGSGEVEQPPPDEPAPTATSEPPPTPADTPPDGDQGGGDGTAEPTEEPTTEPTAEPTAEPTEEPTIEAPASPVADEAATATLDVQTVDHNGQPVLGAGYAVVQDLGDGATGDVVATAVDGDPSDGVTSFADMAAGPVAVVQQSAPRGYLPDPAPRFVTLAAGETATLQVTTPLGGKIVVRGVDQKGALVPGACFSVRVDLGHGVAGDEVRAACDAADGAADGVTTVDTLPAGATLVRASTTPAGHVAGPDVAVSVALGASTEIRFPLNREEPKPKQPAVSAAAAEPTITIGPYFSRFGPTAVTLYWETDQPTVGTVEFGATKNLGTVRPTTPGPESTIHRIELKPLQAGKLYSYKVVGTNANGDVESDLFSFRTAPADATAKVVIKKKNEDGTVLLPGACFDIFRDAGGGALDGYAGGSCDRFDANPTDGKTTVSGLAAGDYVLVENLSPGGYLPVKNRRFSLAKGETKTIIVANAPGGTRLTVSAKTVSGDPILGACYAVYKNIGGQLGPYLNGNCDDLEGLDGKTRLGSFPPGAYLIQPTYAPPGFVIGAELLSVTIKAGKTSVTVTHVMNAQESPGNIIVRAVDAVTSELTPGACFVLFQVLQDGSRPFAADACDWEDGRFDGLTTFVDVAPGRYQLSETLAPTGYQAGARLDFTKQSGALRTLTVHQEKGGEAVKVTTKHQSTGALVPGACYTLYELVGGVYRFVTFACDNNGDGVAQLLGVPAGVYLLVQTVTPAGYQRALDRTIVVEQDKVFITVKVKPT